MECFKYGTPESGMDAKSTRVTLSRNLAADAYHCIRGLSDLRIPVGYRGQNLMKLVWYVGCRCKGSVW